MFRYHKSGYYFSNKINVVHGFGTRMFKHMTLLQRISKTNYIFSMEQVHGHKVSVVNDKLSLTNSSNIFPKTDALIYYKNQSKPITLLVRTADCVPILLWNEKTPFIAVIHSGWQGTLANILSTTIKTMHKLGCQINHTKALIGPAIGNCCYNISNERLKLFKSAFNEAKNNKIFLNLSKLCYMQMRDIGLSKINIDWQNWCTKCQSNSFYSYRYGDRGKEHNNISFIQL